MGVTIRHFFNTMHAGGGMKWWTWAATTILFVIVMWLSTAPMFRQTVEESEARVLTPTQKAMIEAPGWDEASGAVMGRCSMCHAREPSYEGIHTAPKGVLLETPDDITRAAREIYIQAGVTNAMPPANVSFMEPQERQAIINWYRALPKTFASN